MSVMSSNVLKKSTSLRATRSMWRMRIWRKTTCLSMVIALWTSMLRHWAEMWTYLPIWTLNYGAWKSSQEWNANSFSDWRTSWSTISTRDSPWWWCKFSSLRILKVSFLWKLTNCRMLSSWHEEWLGYTQEASEWYQLLKWQKSWKHARRWRSRRS